MPSRGRGRERPGDRVVDERGVCGGVEVVGDGVEVEAADRQVARQGVEVLFGDPERGGCAGHPVAAAGCLAGPVDPQGGADGPPVCDVGQAAQFVRALDVDHRVGGDGGVELGVGLGRAGERDLLGARGEGQVELPAGGDLEAVGGGGDGAQQVGVAVGFHGVEHAGAGGQGFAQGGDPGDGDGRVVDVGADRAVGRAQGGGDRFRDHGADCARLRSGRRLRPAASGRALCAGRCGRSGRHGRRGRRRCWRGRTAAARTPRRGRRG